MNDLEKFVEAMKDVFKDNLESIILYGSQAGDESSAKHSDHNILLVLKEIRFEDMKASGKAISAWVKNGNPAPLLFTGEILKESTDVFPVEFFDIKDNYKLLFGTDLVSGLKIDNTHLRHELEFELKGKLIKLRQGYMMYSQDNKKVQELLIRSISTFLTLFKHTVRLFGQVPPKKKVDALEPLSQKTGINKQVFLNVFNMKLGDKAALKLDVEQVVQEYITEIEKVIKVVNNI
jgi:hypothetical protein